MTQELERWGADPAEPDVPAPYRAAAAAYRALEPSQAQVEHMLQRLELTRAATRAQVSLWRRAGFWRATTLCVLGLGATLLWWKLSVTAPATSNTPAYRPLKEIAKSAGALAAGSAAALDSPATQPVESSPTQSVPATTGAAARPSELVSAPSRAAPVLDTTVRDSGLLAELELLQRARRIVRLAPARALSLTAEHARAYPQGLFVQERELIAIEAELGLGRREQAERRARQFEARYRDSLHRARLQALLATSSR